MALNNQGFLVTMFDGPTKVTFIYDANGNMTVENRGGIRTTFTYDRENRLTVKIDSGSDWRPATVVSAAGVLTTYEYDADGNLTTLTSGGEIKLISYDAPGRLITEVQENSGGTAILSMVDTYDAAGRKTKQVKISATITFPPRTRRPQVAEEQAERMTSP